MKISIYDPAIRQNVEISDLEQFVALCFYGEIKLDFPASSLRASAKLSVDDFLKRQPLEDVRQVQIELRDLLNQNLSEADLEAVLRDMAMYWNFSPYGPWLTSVLSQIDSFLGKSGRSTSASTNPSKPQPSPPRPYTSTISAASFTKPAAPTNLPKGEPDNANSSTKLLGAVLISLILAALLLPFLTKREPDAQAFQPRSEPSYVSPPQSEPQTTSRSEPEPPPTPPPAPIEATERKLNNGDSAWDLRLLGVDAGPIDTPVHVSSDQLILFFASEPFSISWAAHEQTALCDKASMPACAIQLCAQGIAAIPIRASCRYAASAMAHYPSLSSDITVKVSSPLPQTIKAEYWKQ